MEDERVDGRELEPPEEEGSDQRLSDEVLARMSAPTDEEEED